MTNPTGALPPIVHDADALRLVRAALRRCYVEIDAIPTEDRTARVVSDEVKSLAHDIGVEIDSAQACLELVG